VAPAGSLEDALELTGPGRPCDLIMVGCAVCRQSSPDRLAALQRHRPDRRIGMLCGETAQCTGDVAIHLLRLGLAGIFPISLGQTALASAIRLVLDGGRYAPPEMLVSLDPHGKRLDGGNGGLLAARGHSWGAAGGHGECPDKPVADGRLAALSRREREVALLLAQGLANKEIAWRLELQEVTIKVHATSIYRKLGVRNRAQAVVKLLAAAKAEAAEA
jgi:DNA-binding NarL/FixJ family response regulator